MSRTIAETDQPTEKQVAFYRRLADHPSLKRWERDAALNFLERGLTRQQLSQEIDALKLRISRAR